MPKFQTPHAKELVEALRKNLPDKTFRHSISVAEWLETVADAARIEREKAVTAGLLHDLCKGMKPDDLLKRAERYGIKLTDAQRQKPGLLHGPVAAEMGRRKFDVEDEDIYDAVYYHTTGRPDWGRVGMALYIADFSEPLRSYEEAGEARRILAKQGFEPALRYVAEQRLDEVRKKTFVDPLTEAFHNWLHTGNGYKR